MKNKLFFSSLIIMGMITASITTSFATSDTLNFEVPSFFSVEADSSSVLSGTLSITSDTQVSITNPLSVTFNVASSNNATVLVASYDGSNVGTILKNVIPFYLEGESDVGDRYHNAFSSEPTIARNKNVISFPISCNSPNEIPSGTYLGYYYAHYFNHQVEEGEMQITCTISGDSIVGTYGDNDEPGNYVAKLSFIRIAP